MALPEHRADGTDRIEYIHNLADEKGNTINPASIGMPADFPQDLRNLVTFKDAGHGKTQLIVTEFAWPVGQMMEMSRMGMEQCLDKMADALRRSERRATAGPRR